MNGKQIIKKLKEYDWYLKRIRGSHVMANGTITVPVPLHGSKDIPIGTLKRYIHN